MFSMAARRFSSGPLAEVVRHRLSNARVVAAYKQSPVFLIKLPGDVADDLVRRYAANHPRQWAALFISHGSDEDIWVLRRDRPSVLPTSQMIGAIALGVASASTGIAASLCAISGEGMALPFLGFSVASCALAHVLGEAGNTNYTVSDGLGECIDEYDARRREIEFDKMH